MSNYPLSQRFYRSDFDYFPSRAYHYSLSHPISDTEGRPPPISNPTAVNEDSSPSSRNNEHVIQNSSTYHPPPSHQWTSQRADSAASRFPSSSCQSQSYNGNQRSLDLPPLNNIQESRKQYPELISSNHLSPEESVEDGPGLPPVLDKFKLEGPQSPKNSHSSYPLKWNLNAMSTRHEVDSRSQSSVTYPPSIRRKQGRSTQAGRDDIMGIPYFSNMISKALGGSKLDDITPNQMKTLVKRHPISPELSGKWEDHAIYNPDPRNPKNEYQCNICQYSAKKQLIARHINGTHLGIKIFGCPFCGNTYSQIMSLLCHIAVHLRVFPYKCRWCNQRFNDMARLHRHITAEHGYKAKETKRTPKSKKS